MESVHNVVGTLVVIAFLTLTVVNVVRVTGRPVSFATPLSYLAGALLLLQIVLGFALLGSGREIAPIHYILGLLALVTIGVEHGYARTRTSPDLRAMASLLATGATTILVAAAHIIGSSNLSG